MTPDQETKLLETVARIGFKMDFLINDDGSTGQFPFLRNEHELLKASHVVLENRITAQEAYWKGAFRVIAIVCSIISVCILAFGGVLFAHILGGK